MTVQLHLLDTDIASYIIKRRSSTVVARLASIPPDRVAVSVVTRAELLYGLKRLPPTHRLHVAVRRFLRIVRVPAWDADAADCYADIRHQLASAGQTIGDMDMMIAAHAIALGAVLVTNNVRHFKRIAALPLLADWSE